MNKKPKTNLVIPMAGRGSRFIEAGWATPKPFIQFGNGKRLIEVVTENVTPKRGFHDVRYLALSEHVDDLQYKDVLPEEKIYRVEQVTEGAACTVLLVEDFINNDNPLLLANSDQYVIQNMKKKVKMFSIDDFIKDALGRGLDGSIVTFTASEPKWSFAKLSGETGLVTEVAEKQPISDIATVGIYWFRHGSDFVKYAKQMIDKDIRVNGEFYVCPVFNEAIGDGKKIGIYHVNEMLGFGTPEDLAANAWLFNV